MLPYSMKPFGLTTYESFSSESTGRTLTFSPRLRVQRYMTVEKVLRDFSESETIKTVTEFGSNNCVFFCQHLLTCEFLTTVNLVDIDRTTIETALPSIALERYRETRSNGRNPLTVNVFEGNVSHKDDRVRDSDVVVAIELIEHLFPDDLHEFRSTVFGFIQPKLVIITTPNYEFNVLFERGQKFRHDDHKFEFTRKQFENWANDIIGEFDYTVDLYGIGEPPVGSEDIGYCSQMAVFKKLPTVKTTCIPEISNDYILVGSYQYFYISDGRTDEEKILEELCRVTARYGDDHDYELSLENETCELSHTSTALPLSLFVEHCKNWLPTENDMLKFLEKYPVQYPLRRTKENDFVIILQNDCDIYGCKL